MLPLVRSRETHCIFGKQRCLTAIMNPFVCLLPFMEKYIDYENINLSNLTITKKFYRIIRAVNCITIYINLVRRYRSFVSSDEAM